MENEFDALGGALDILADLEGDAQSNEFNIHAKAMVNCLFVLLRTSAQHALSNDAMNHPLDHLIDTVNGFIQKYHEDCAVQLVEDNFFVNKQLVKLDFGTFQNTKYLKRIFEFLEVNEITFGDGVDRESLLGLCKGFLGVVRDRRGRFVDYPMGTIKARQLNQAAAGIQEQKADPRDRILTIYASGLLTLRQFINDLRHGKNPRHARVKRVCLDLIDIDPRFHNLLLTLVQLEAYKGTLFSHLLNTGVLSVVVGQRLGLTKRQLVDLGMAAFHHDLGRAMADILDAPDRKQIADLGMEVRDLRRGGEIQKEAEEMRLTVARSLIRIGGFNESVINRLIVAYESQVPDDEPVQHLYYGDIDISFMTQVVRMASLYDDLTTRKPDRQAVPPDQAMSRILDDNGVLFDPFLAKLFANCLGQYPVGTLVELDTTEVGLVVNLPMNPVNFHRPQVKILVDKSGTPLAEGPVEDLNDTYRGGGRFKRTVERTLTLQEYGISVTRFFFG